MVPRAIRAGISFFILSTLLFGFANCGPLRIGGSGEPYEGVTNDGDRSGFLPNHGETTFYICTPNDLAFSYLNVQLGISMVADPIVQIDQMQGLVLENLYSGAQSGSLMVQINAYQQIRSITVTNNLVKLSILNQQTTKSITVSYTCSFID